MAQLPVEIARIGNAFSEEIEAVVELFNNTQKEIRFSILSNSDEEKFQLLDFKQADTHELLDKIGRIRSELKGFHPYLLIITSTSLSNKLYDNLFGEAYPENGVAVFTFNNIADIIIPTRNISSYIAYYLTRYTLNFLIPSHRNHKETRECVFDEKISKTDIIKSMKAGAICDDCRTVIMSPQYSISAPQFASLNILFGKSQELYKDNNMNVELRAKKAKIFIGSSTEGLTVARKIQSELSFDFEIVIWNQGIFDKLGLSFLEILEQTVNTFDYGIFVFTPDDKIESKGQTKSIARDNVIFELGMFIGKLSRKKAFLVYTQKSDMHILSDFSGITMANYDPTTSNLQAALGPVCESIRVSIGQITK